MEALLNSDMIANAMITGELRVGEFTWPDRAAALYDILVPGFRMHQREHGCEFAVNEARTALDAVFPSGERRELVSLSEFDDGSYKLKFKPRMAALAES